MRSSPENHRSFKKIELKAALNADLAAGLTSTLARTSPFPLNKLESFTPPVVEAVVSEVIFTSVFTTSSSPLIAPTIQVPPSKLIPVNRKIRRFLAMTASKKGGVGKSTVALLIADAAKLNGIELTVIQVDDQNRLEQTIKQSVITIRIPFREARKNPALLSQVFDPVFAAIESMAAGGPSVLIDLGPTEVDYFVEWAKLVELDQDLLEFGIEGIVVVPAVAEPEALRQAGRTLSLFARALPSMRRVFMENARDGAFAELAPGSEAARVLERDLASMMDAVTKLIMPGIDAGSWQHFERSCCRFIDVISMDVQTVMRITGLSRPQSKLVRGDVAHFFSTMEGELSRVLPVGEAE